MQDIQSLLQAYQTLPQDQRDALKMYAAAPPWPGGTSFTYDINKSLRAGIIHPDATAIITAIDAAITSYQLKHPATVYRAVDDVAHLGQLSVGMRWSPTSFISASTWWGNLSTHLIPPPVGKTIAGVLTLRLGHGTAAAYLGGIPSLASEKEVLLGREMTFRVTSFGDGKIGNYTTNPGALKCFDGLIEVTLEAI